MKDSPSSRRGRLLLALVAIGLMSPALISAQGLTGAIFGEVVDGNGGRLPGVVVTLTSAQLIQGQETTTTTDQGPIVSRTCRPGLTR